MELIVYSLAVCNLCVSYIFIAFWQVYVRIDVLLLDQHYFLITAISILEFQEGFTRPFIVNNTEVLPVLKGLGKILIN